MAGRGSFRRGLRRPTTRAIFLLASISKPMTATGVMTLYDAGKLTLDDPVMKFIPEFSEGDRAKITIRHLLTHTSGLPDQLPNNSELRGTTRRCRNSWPARWKVPLKFEPGHAVQLPVDGHTARGGGLPAHHGRGVRARS
ncbi:MAG: serine hydrolase domain-containing protein [Bryobacterales bacterium]